MGLEAACRTSRHRYLHRLPHRLLLETVWRLWATPPPLMRMEGLDVVAWKRGGEGWGPVYSRGLRKPWGLQPAVSEPPGWLCEAQTPVKAHPRGYWTRVLCSCYSKGA